jgi:hypothetical protein
VQPQRYGDSGLFEGTPMSHPRRSVLKWLAALPLVGLMVPKAQAAKIEYAIITSNDPCAASSYLYDGCLRQVAMYRAKAQLYAGLLSDKMDHPHWPALDMFVTDWGIDLLVMGYDAYPENWRVCTHHELFSFDEIEDGHTYKDEFYARLRKIMERYT